MDRAPYPMEYEDEAHAFSVFEESFEYVDNFRIWYLQDNIEGIDDYNTARKAGCCGSIDVLAVVGGRYAMIGCNYGH